ncbi:tRNA-binding protein [Numidum massiliense]|uniref:tRNA-binding protein n=1 Tax=Numidum massiliense TaxID=1522315 RepID=UPI0006D5A2EE|nr:tRNA-binding protein [Numidum massiliense]
MATIDDWNKLDIRVGEVIDVKDFPEARKPAFQLWVDFGPELGVKQSSAQLTELYTKDTLLGRQVVAVVNFPPLRVAGFKSEILVLGIYAEEGVVLLQPDRPVQKGDKIG